MDGYELEDPVTQKRKNKKEVWRRCSGIPCELHTVQAAGWSVQTWFWLKFFKHWSFTGRMETLHRKTK